MKLEEIEKEYIYKYNLNCSDEEQEELCKIAIEEFANDIPAQIEYAVRFILSKALEGLESEESEENEESEKTG